LSSRRVGVEHNLQNQASSLSLLLLPTLFLCLKQTAFDFTFF
jgi:hypothetical protein